MLKSGLVSISFRSLSVKEIIELCKECNLKSIEWGSDVHVPYDNLEYAKEVRETSEEAGVEIAGYGSYYRLGTYGDNYLEEFRKYLETAKVLKAPYIRIWAGYHTPSETTDKETRDRLVKEAKEIGLLANDSGIKVCFECHNRTLTDEYHSTVKLMQEIGMDNVLMYWQPNETKDDNYNKEALVNILPYLTNVHVFNWPSVGIREPLETGKDKWNEYLEIIKEDNKEHYCLIEFVPDDKPETLMIEAKTLNEWLR